MNAPRPGVRRLESLAVSILAATEWESMGVTHLGHFQIVVQSRATGSRKIVRGKSVGEAYCALLDLAEASAKEKP